MKNKLKMKNENKDIEDLEERISELERRFEALLLEIIKKLDFSNAKYI